MEEDRRESTPGLELPVLFLVLCVFVSIVLVRMGSPPIIEVQDVVLHGGWSFLLMLGGCFALRHAVGILAKADEWMIFVGVLGLGLALEVAQYYWRIDSTVGDLAIDAVGATAGWAFWHVCVGVEARIHQRRNDG